MAVYRFEKLDDWVAETVKRTEAVIQTSVERICEIAQTPLAQGGRMPVDTGTLRNSFVSSLNGQIAVGPASYTVVLGDFGIGDIAEFGWGGQASGYARRQNYGFIGEDSAGRTYNFSGYHWLENAMEQFGRVVAEETAKARAAARK